MHVRLIAVGDSPSDWVDQGFAEYTRRLPQHWRFKFDSIATAPRSGRDLNAARSKEGQKLIRLLKPGEYAVLLDERGKRLSSRDLAGKLTDWQANGRDLCFLIGGPDGVSEDVRSRADFTWCLSNMTLPHGLARVLCAEQLYRAWTITQGHPYHRD